MLRKFSEEGFDLGFKFRDAVGVRLLGHDRLGDVLGDGEQILVRHLSVAQHLAAVFADKLESVFASVPVFALGVDDHGKD
jgi:hypothetical protein